MGIEAIFLAEICSISVSCPLSSSHGGMLRETSGGRRSSILNTLSAIMVSAGCNSCKISLSAVSFFGRDITSVKI